MVIIVQKITTLALTISFKDQTSRAFQKLPGKKFRAEKKTQADQQTLPKTSQLLLESSIDFTSVWDINDQRAQ